MALNFEDIVGHPALNAAVQAQARAMQQAYEGNPRASSVFATQQRWLMAHICLALHFRRDPSDYRKELTAARFVDVTVQHAVASRNTAQPSSRKCSTIISSKSVQWPTTAAFAPCTCPPQPWSC
ncbi:hypothetical protein [Mesorhizobium sp. M2A.F.Ca.ET.015.02.1.1]|uniref:hypothetical protein n=1 Tax=unclassified Mesorhizobium TaxID=325217 RepID=UPI00167E768C